MLQIKHTHRLRLPHLPVAPARMQLSTVTVDSDELSAAIINDTATRDDTWELNERPDMGELTRFWEEVSADVAKDPEWFKFSEE